MPIKSSGSLSMDEINTEFAGTAPYSFDEYYRGGVLVPNVAANNAVSTSGAISIGMFYGAQKYVPLPGNQAWDVPGTYTFTVPQAITSIRVRGVGAGGGGSGAGTDGGDSGFGGGAGGWIDQSYTVTSGQLLTVKIGTGGAGGIGTLAAPNTTATAAKGKNGATTTITELGLILTGGIGNASVGNSGFGPATPGANSLYTTNIGGTTGGAAGVGGGGGNGNHGGGGGGGARYSTLDVNGELVIAFGNGGRGGHGWLRIDW